MMDMMAKPHLAKISRTDPDLKTRKGFIRLDMNESVSGLPLWFVKESADGLDPDLLARYPECRSLVKKIADHNGLEPENICVSNGSDAAIKYIFDAYVSPGDKILLTDPTFAMYPVYCDIFQAKRKVVNYRKDLLFPTKDFIGAISEDVRMAVLVNPNNPTGSVIDPKSLDIIIKKAAAEHVLILIDEAYFYFYPKTIIREVSKFNNLIVLRTFSKLCAMASLRLGYAAACPEIIRGLKKTKPTYDVSGVAAHFAEKLLDNPEVIETLIKGTDDGKRYLIQKLSENGIGHVSGYANFVLIRCSGKAENLAKRLSQEHILVGSGFAQDYLKDCIRITVGDKKIMERFWAAFIDIWNGLK